MSDGLKRRRQNPSIKSSKYKHEPQVVTVSISETALQGYEKHTGRALTNHPHSLTSHSIGTRADSM